MDHVAIITSINSKLSVSGEFAFEKKYINACPLRSAVINGNPLNLLSTNNLAIIHYKPHAG